MRGPILHFLLLVPTILPNPILDNIYKQLRVCNVMIAGPAAYGLHVI